MNGNGSQDQVLAANEDAAAFYRRTLLEPAATGPRQYLVGRGFEALLENPAWTVGHAPGEWTALHEHLNGLGYSDETQIAAGLVLHTRHGTLIDRFRNRITFGIRQPDHALVGFTARCAPGAQIGVPKYLNTPSTAVYDKSAVLFGLGETPLEGRIPVVVEGPLDALAIHLADAGGQYTPLALCGSRMTSAHATLIGAAAPQTVILALDPDPAGHRGLANAYGELVPHVADIRGLALAPGSDPADLLAITGSRSLASQLAVSGPALDQIVDSRLATWPDLDNAEARVSCLRGVAALLARLRPPEIATCAVVLQRRLNLEHETVATELAHAALAHSPHGPIGSQRETAHPAHSRYVS